MRAGGEEGAAEGGTQAGMENGEPADWAKWGGVTAPGPVPGPGTRADQYWYRPVGTHQPSLEQLLGLGREFEPLRPARHRDEHRRHTEATLGDEPSRGSLRLLKDRPRRAPIVRGGANKAGRPVAQARLQMRPEAQRARREQRLLPQLVVAQSAEAVEGLQQQRRVLQGVLLVEMGKVADALVGQNLFAHVRPKGVEEPVGQLPRQPQRRQRRGGHCRELLAVGNEPGPSLGGELHGAHRAARNWAPGNEAERGEPAEHPCQPRREFADGRLGAHAVRSWIVQSIEAEEGDQQSEQES